MPLQAQGLCLSWTKELGYEQKILVSELYIFKKMVCSQLLRTLASSAALCLFCFILKCYTEVVDLFSNDNHTIQCRIRNLFLFWCDCSFSCFNSPLQGRVFLVIQMIWFLSSLGPVPQPVDFILKRTYKSTTANNKMTW